MNHRFFRRVRSGAVVVAAALSVALVAAGCSSSGDSSGDQVTIRFNWWGSDTRHANTQKIIDKFEEAHPNITVQPEYSNYNDYWNKLSTSAASNDLPDVMQVIDPFMYQYIDNGQLLDLNKVSDTLSIAKLPETSLSMVKVNGGLYGVPAGVAGFGIAIDPEAFKAAGVPVPDDTAWTWDNYIQTAAAISKATPKVAGSGLPLDSQLAVVWLRQHGEDWWTADGKDIGFKPETLAGYWEWVLKLRDSGGTPGVEAAIESASAGSGVEQSDLARHKAAIMGLSVNQLAALQKASGRDEKVLLFPGEAAGQPGSYTKPGIFYGISARSEHPKEAALLVEYLVNSPEAAKIQKFDRGVPANPEVVAAIESELSPAEQAVAGYYKRVDALKPKPLPIPNVNAGPALVEIFERINQDVLFGRITPQKAGQKYASELKAEF